MHDAMRISFPFRIRVGVAGSLFGLWHVNCSSDEGKEREGRDEKTRRGGIEGRTKDLRQLSFSVPRYTNLDYPRSTVSRLVPLVEGRVVQVESKEEIFVSTSHLLGTSP